MTRATKLASMDGFDCFNLGVWAYYHLGCIWTWIFGLSDGFLFFSFRLLIFFVLSFFSFFGLHDFYYTIMYACMNYVLSRQHNWWWCNMDFRVCLAACYLPELSSLYSAPLYFVLRSLYRMHACMNVVMYVEVVVRLWAASTASRPYIYSHMLIIIIRGTYYYILNYIPGRRSNRIFSLISPHRCFSRVWLLHSWGTGGGSSLRPYLH